MYWMPEWTGGAVLGGAMLGGVLVGWVVVRARPLLLRG